MGINTHDLFTTGVLQDSDCRCCYRATGMLNNCPCECHRMYRQGRAQLADFLSEEVSEIGTLRCARKTAEQAMGGQYATLCVDTNQPNISFVIEEYQPTDS